MSFRQLSNLINPDFVGLWEPAYDTKKYPLDFLLRHSADARNAQDPEALKNALVALLHWKDGKAGNFVAGESHAKPNTLRPILALQGLALTEFATLFRRVVEAANENVGQCTQSLLDRVSEMWNSVVIPAFVLHIARPDRLPMIDQHTTRAFLQLIHSEIVENPQITWRLWREYIVFFHDAMLTTGWGSELERRYYLDRALFAYGKSLKGLFNGKPRRAALGVSLAYAESVQRKH